MIWSPCSPRYSWASSPAPQFKSISSLALSLLYGLTLISIHDYWKTHSFHCILHLVDIKYTLDEKKKMKTEMPPHWLTVHCPVKPHLAFIGAEDEVSHACMEQGEGDSCGWRRQQELRFGEPATSGGRMEGCSVGWWRFPGAGQLRMA